jgi:hypothetical protein
MSIESVEKEVSIRAEACIQQQVRPVTTQERLAMRRAFEDNNGKLPQCEVPSPEYLACKMEESEQEEPAASPLDEVLSIDDTESQATSASLDMSGRIRIIRQKSKGKMPVDSEELSTRLRIECHMWMFMGIKFPHKTWLQGIRQAFWGRYCDFLLGDKVFNLKVPTINGESMEPM